jgi:hypothetical protein
MVERYVLTDTTIESAKEVVVRVLQSKDYKILQSLENKIVAKHGLAATYYPHEIEVSFIAEGNYTAILASITHHGGEEYLKRFFSELTKFIKPVPITVTPPNENEAVIANRNLNSGEQIIWVHVIKKGALKKVDSERWIITNLRAIKHILPTDENPQEKFMAIPLRSTDVVVMNQYRKSKGDRVGVFAGGYSGGGVAGVSTSSSSGVSMTYGDLVFLYNGKEFFRFQGISDPHGVSRVINMIKKQQKSM